MAKRPKARERVAGGQWILELTFEDKEGRTVVASSHTLAESWVRNNSDAGHWLKVATSSLLDRI